MAGPSPIRPPERAARRRGLLASLRARAHDASERLFSSRVPWILLFFVIVAPLTLGPRLAPEPPSLSIGSVAPSDIAAVETREFIDETATQEAREAARQAVRPIYDVDSRALEDAGGSLRGTLASWRATGPQTPRHRGPARSETSAVAE